MATSSVVRMASLSGAKSIERVLYTRSDGKWAWRLVVNGNIVATDGSQGYDNESDCRQMADRVIGGYYSEAQKKIIRPKHEAGDRHWFNPHA